VILVRIPQTRMAPQLLEPSKGLLCQVLSTSIRASSELRNRFIATAKTPTKTVTAIMVAVSLTPMLFMIMKPRPRRDANISPIITPSSVIEKLMRRPLMISGSVAGKINVKNFCSGVKFIIRAARSNAGFMLAMALMVIRIIGIMP
jgi:hypothetical protein